MSADAPVETDAPIRTDSQPRPPKPKGKQRKSQSEEAYLEQFQQFESEGPLVQEENYFDLCVSEKGEPVVPGAMYLTPKMELNTLKSAAERQYYLRNYSSSLLIAQRGLQSAKGVSAKEFERIITAAMKKLV